METYINHDERFGEPIEFTLPEMIACYRENHWHDEMTDAEIESDILDHDVELVLPGEINDGT